MKSVVEEEEEKDFPFAEIIQKDDADLLQYWITNHQEVLERFGVDESLLEFASHYSCPRVVKTLLASKLKVPFGTALNRAAQNNSKEIVGYLLEAKAHVGGWMERDYTPYRPLHNAITNKNMAIALQLLEAGDSIVHIEKEVIVPECLVVHQRCLAARQLARRATERALRHAGLHKDMIPVIVRWVAHSDLEKWEVICQKGSKK
jgi:hypothetical protein